MTRQTLMTLLGTAALSLYSIHPALAATTTILQDTLSSTSVQPGAKVNVTYHWQAVKMPANYEVFVHFIDANGNTVFYDDHYPPVATTQWYGNVNYTRTVTIPSTLAPGTYRIDEGLFSFSNGTYTNIPLIAGPGVTTLAPGYVTGSLTIGGTSSGGTTTGSLSAPAGYSSPQLTFDTKFTESSLNTAYWNPYLGDHYGIWNDGGELPSPYSGGYAPSYQVQYDDPYPSAYSTNLSGQHLVTGSTGLREIATANSHFFSLGYSWASTAINSYNKITLPATGGYVQFLAKMPDSTHGAWAGLWFMPNSGSGGAEFDLQESGYPSNGAPNANYVLASHWWGTNGKQIIQNTGIDLSAGFHVYGVEYRPNQSWTVYLDGKQMATWTGSIGSASYEILIDLEMAGSTTNGWHTVVDSSHPGPYELDVKELQVYKLP